MYSVLAAIAILLILAVIWVVIKHKRDLRKDNKIFDEYMQKQREIKFNRRGRA